MRYVNIPIVDKKNPGAAQIDEFLKLVDDPQTGKFMCTAPEADIVQE